jgi:hypothetical protein
LIRYVKVFIGAKGFTNVSKFNPILSIFKIPSFSEAWGAWLPNKWNKTSRIAVWQLCCVGVRASYEEKE